MALQGRKSVDVLERKLIKNSSFAAGCLLIVLLSLLQPNNYAFAAPVFLNTELNELNVVVETSLHGRRGMVFIENNEVDAVLCHITFKNGPELPVKRKQRVGPGIKKMITATLSRSIVRLNIDVLCGKEQVAD